MKSFPLHLPRFGFKESLLERAARRLGTPPDSHAAEPARRRSMDRMVTRCVVEEERIAFARVQ